MAKNNIQLSDHFNYRHLLRYTVPSILMLIFTSVYSVVDGFFVSNFTGKTPFAAVNFIMPLLMILGCAGFMFGTGGGAIIAKTMGVGDNRKANELFSMIVYAAAACGIVLAALGILFLRPIASLMGADGELLENCIIYGRIILLALPFYILQYEFQCLFAGDVIPLIYFGRKNNSLLQLGKCKIDRYALAKTCTNGSSELMNNISMSVVSMLFNVQLMKYAGETASPHTAY